MNQRTVNQRTVRQRTRRVATALVSFALFALTACTTPAGMPGDVATLQPGERPTPGSDEAGLWMEMDRAELSLLQSTSLVRNPALHNYMQGIVCRLAGPHCNGLRVYIVRNPEFNVSMAPNGMMLVWTGLLLRMENEAQLAFVLGHETGHYLRRHSWQQFRDRNAKSAFLQVLSIAMRFAAAAAGVPVHELVASGVQLGAGVATLGSVYAFSRDGEWEADEVGFELMVRAGYDPREAPRAWDRLMAEARASGTSRPPLFFATHPPTDERVTTLQQLADRAAQGAGRVARDEYRQHLAPIRRLLMRDEIHRREFVATEVLLRRLVEDGVSLGEVHFFRGEMYRLRSATGDLAEAVTAYRRALEFLDAPPETHRNLGLLLARTEGRVEAGEALARYLEQRPDAEDREMIKSQIDDLARQP